MNFVIFDFKFFHLTEVFWEDPDRLAPLLAEILALIYYQLLVDINWLSQIIEKKISFYVTLWVNETSLDF